MRFGCFQVAPDRREFLVDGVPVSLGSRAFDVAHLLVEAQGKLVTKDEILRRVWNDTIVEENSLQVAISALRKALGPLRERVKTVSGRGYLIVDVEQRQEAFATNNLPLQASHLIGRAVALEEVGCLAGKHRLVTLTGAGGIGKTRLGLAAASSLMPRFSDGMASRLRFAHEFRTGVAQGCGSGRP